jgi:hypothetical protein
MSTVLQFKSLTRGGREGARRPHQPCEIVIFPGVRIERHAEPETLAVGDFEGGEGLYEIDATRSRTN